jgi:hypothetical protein
VIVLVDFVRGIKLPFSDYKKLGIGVFIGLFTLIPFLSIIATITLNGYGTLVAKQAMKKKKAALPDWNDWGNMLLKGIYILAIDVAYIMPALLVTMLGGGLALVSAGGLSQGINYAALASSFAGVGIILLIALVLWIAAFYFVPMATMQYVSKGKLGAAFDFNKVIERSFRPNYLVTWLFTIVYIALLSIAASVLGVLISVTYIGPWIVSGAFIVVSMVTLFDIYGQVYAES